MTSSRLIRIFAISMIAVVFVDSLSGQDYKARVGYTKLQSEVGAGLPTGAGVSVALAEANTGAAGTNTYFPDTANTEFTGKTFTDVSGLTPRNTSGHATGVSALFFGQFSSLAPGITNIQVYDAEDFVENQQRLTQVGVNPAATTPFSVMNHSYIGFGIPTAIANEANARLDYTVNRDKFTSVVGLGNGGALPQIYGQSYNSISVGRSDGGHSAGPTDLGVTGRVKPDIVAPLGTTSQTTALVSSAAALLHASASSFGMPNARNSESMKAIIMAGATKNDFAWSNTTTQPLDSTYGAGQLNVYNSYRILEAGEVNGSTTVPISSTASNFGLQGWDYGASITGGTSQFWNFNIAEGQSPSEASILLTWNAQFADSGGNFTSTLTLANMDLRLFTSSNGVLGTEVASSLSTVDNVEHIYLNNLSAGLYTIVASSNINTSFGLAWRITAIPEPGTVACLSVFVLFMSAKALRRKRRTARRHSTNIAIGASTVGFLRSKK
jgi:hypothetical protein